MTAFQLDHSQYYTAQIEQFLKANDKTLESCDLDLELSKQLVDCFVTAFDFGSHSNNSETHKQEIYYILAEYIVRQAFEMKEFFEDFRFEVAEYNQKFLMKCFRRYFHSCKFCGAEVLTQYKNGVLTAITEPLTISAMYTYHPPKDTACYNYDQVEVSVVAQSDTLIIANDLRPYLKDQSIGFDDNEYNICTPYGRIRATKAFAEKNILCLSAGNTTMSIFQNKDQVMITNGYRSDIEEYDYTEDIKDLSREINAHIHTHKMCLKEEISCSLWWVMGASESDIDMEKLKDAGVDFYALSVKKGKTYTVSYDSTKNYFKSYRLAL